jgi:hypothetical protein
MFIPFTPHKVKLKTDPLNLYDVIAIDIIKKKMDIKEKTIEDLKVHPFQPNDSLPPTMKIQVGIDDDDEDEDTNISPKSVKEADIITIWLLIINPLTKKYEWILQSQCEPQPNK